MSTAAATVTDRSDRLERSIQIDAPRSRRLEAFRGNSAGSEGQLRNIQGHVAAG